MNISIVGNQAIIHASGMNFLKLKTEMVNRIGNLSKAGKDTIEIPASCLSLIVDLLDDNSKNDGSVRQYLKKFSNLWRI